LDSQNSKHSFRLPRPSALFSGVSLAIGIALTYLLIWTGMEESRVSMPFGNARYSIITQHGCITLMSPPPAAPGSGAASEMVKRMSNGDIEWTLWPDVPGEHGYISADANATKGGTAEIFRQFPQPSDAPIRPLLRALDDPNKVFAAHVALIKMTRVGDTFVGFNNPFEKVQPVVTETEWQRLEGFPILMFPHTAQKPRIDLTHWQATRDLWHKRLDVRIFSLDFEWLLVASLAVPLLRLVQQMGRVRAKSHGLCPTCRYDLTGNLSGRCPECGEVVAERPGRDVQLKHVKT
jgi:hypothetical protein